VVEFDENEETLVHDEVEDDEDDDEVVEVEDEQLSVPQITQIIT
jgi:hypothetical protein